MGEEGWLRGELGGEVGFTDAIDMWSLPGPPSMNYFDGRETEKMGNAGKMKQNISFHF